MIGLDLILVQWGVELVEELCGELFELNLRN